MTPLRESNADSELTENSQALGVPGQLSPRMSFAEFQELSKSGTSSPRAGSRRESLALPTGGLSPANPFDDVEGSVEKTDRPVRTALAFEDSQSDGGGRRGPGTAAQHRPAADELWFEDSQAGAECGPRPPGFGNPADALGSSSEGEPPPGGAAASGGAAAAEWDELLLSEGEFYALRLLFAIFARSGRPYLAEEDLRALAEEQGDYAQAGELAGCLAAMDADGDGRVDLTDFLLFAVRLRHLHGHATAAAAAAASSSAPCPEEESGQEGSVSMDPEEYDRDSKTHTPLRRDDQTPTPPRTVEAGNFI